MDRRERIVTVAESLFAERGYSATRVAEIAEAAGLSPGAGGLYRHFESKEALLVAVVDRASERLQVTLDHRSAFEALDLPLDSSVKLIGHALLTLATESRNLLIILDRDLPRFPELMNRAWRDLVAPALGSLDSWLTEQVPVPNRESFDGAALATVAWRGIRSRVISPHELPEVSDVRFIDAWALAVRGALELASHDAAE